MKKFLEVLIVYSLVAVFGTWLISRFILKIKDPQDMPNWLLFLAVSGFIGVILFLLIDTKLESRYF